MDLGPVFEKELGDFGSQSDGVQGGHRGAEEASGVIGVGIVLRFPTRPSICSLWRTEAPSVL